MKTERVSAKRFVVLSVLSILLIGSVAMCTTRIEDVDPNPPENKEQIRTEQEDTRDSVPPGHHPENDDDDPYGGKYDPIWLH